MWRFPDRIETPRLTLRPIAAGDADALTALYADTAAMSSVGGPRSRRQACDEIAEAVASFELFGLGMRAIVRRQDHRVIGRCDLALAAHRTPPELELGYLLARDAWGAGFATEAARALCEAAFGCGVARVLAVIANDNPASLAVAERLGMRPHDEARTDGSTTYAIDHPAGL